MLSKACTAFIWLLAAAVLNGPVACSRPPATSRPPKPEGLYHAPRGEFVRQIDLRDASESSRYLSAHPLM